MFRSRVFLAAALSVILAPFANAQSGAGARGPTLTDADRAQIKELSTAHGRALGMCLADGYAGLFAAPDGYFASGPRGKGRRARAAAGAVAERGLLS